MHATFRGIFEFHMMVSCEPRCSSAYSEDLRWRMVWESEALGCSYSTIAQNLNVDKSMVCRTIQLFYSTGTVSKRDYPKESPARKLSNPAQLHLVWNIEWAVWPPGYRSKYFNHILVSTWQWFYQTEASNHCNTERWVSMKTLDWDMKDITDVEIILLTAFTAITPENCRAWISASGLFY